MTNGIERPFTAQEARTMRKVGGKTWKEEFVEELHKFEQQYTKDHKPFDRACANADFEDKYSLMEMELQRTEGYANPSDLRLKIEMGDMNEYGRPDRFEKVTEVEDVVNRNVDGMIVPATIGITEQYICKRRKHRVGVLLPANILIERQKKEAAKMEAIAKIKEPET